MGEEGFSELELQQPIEEPRATEGGDLEPREPKKRGWLTPLLLGLGIGIAVASGGIRAFSNRSTAQNTPAKNPPVAVAPSMTVTSAVAEATTVAQTLSVTGSIAARDLTPVLPQANGLQVKQVLVDVGDYVKAGQVMAVLDNSILQDQIRQARADVDSRQADVGSRQADLQSKQAAVTAARATVASAEALVQQRQADLGQARARLLEAERNYRRNQQLFDQGAISRQTLDTAETNLTSAREGIRQAQANILNAQASVSTARANVGSAEAGVRVAQASINSAEATVRSNNAKVEQFRTQLGQTLLRAPVSGTIAEKLTRVGDVTGVPPQTQVGTVVGGSQKLFSIVQDGKLELQAQVPEVQLSQVKVGSNVQITSELDSGTKLQGRVREIEPVVNQQRREATVKIDLPTTNLLKPGTFARALITVTTQTGTAIPQKAAQPQPDGSAIVFVLTGEGGSGGNGLERVKAAKVEVGEILNNDRIEIKSGLRVGDRVVVDGAGYVKDGDTVKIATGTSR